MPELRHDPVQGRWVIIATERGLRPSDFKLETAKIESNNCPFCAGQESKTPPEVYAIRPEGSPPNGQGWEVRVVSNKFPALQIEGALDRAAVGHYDRINGIGAHEVIIESPEHSRELFDQDPRQIARILTAYRERIRDLSQDPRFRYILIFKNYGSIGGASLSHPHSQLIATPITPRTVAIELENAKNHYSLKERCLYCDLLRQEIDTRERIVAMDEHFMTICPYASRFPFEMHLFPRQHTHTFRKISDDLIIALAHHLKEVLARMKKALDNPPYNYLIHTAPNTAARHTRPGYWATLQADFHWHFEILPRLTNTAGFEWGTGFYINPTAPEEAARYLREVEI